MAITSTDTRPEVGDEVFDADGKSAGKVVEIHHGSRRGPKDTGDISYYVTLDNDQGCHVLHDGNQFNIL